MKRALIIVAAIAVVAAAAAAYITLYQAVRDIETAISRPVTIANPVETVTIANPVETITVANPVETVTVANPVEIVTVANPVETVTIGNPVDEVTVTNVVETASPRNSSLYGYCFPTGSGGYEINVVAFGGGIEKTVAAGTYADDAVASAIALEIGDYYGGGGVLDFGSSSSECHHLAGWGS